MSVRAHVAVCGVRGVVCPLGGGVLNPCEGRPHVGLASLAVCTEWCVSAVPGLRWSGSGWGRPSARRRLRGCTRCVLLVCLSLEPIGTVTKVVMCCQWGFGDFR